MGMLMMEAENSASPKPFMLWASNMGQPSKRGKSAFSHPVKECMHYAQSHGLKCRENAAQQMLLLATGAPQPFCVMQS